MYLFSGPATIVASGMVTTFFGHRLLLSLDLETHVARVELWFATDAEVPDVALRIDQTPIGWVVECVNFDGPEGRGTSVPAVLADLGDELLYLHFRVFRYGRTDDRTVHYTFYRAPKPTDGDQSTAGGTPG
jgi:hypothetical protein